MKTVRLTIDPAIPSSMAIGKIDPARVDGTTEQDIAFHQAVDDTEAAKDAARFVRRMRRRLGMTQQEFSQRLDIPIDTVRNWEQGKRSPTGAAKTLLKVLDKSPEAVLAALEED